MIKIIENYLSFYFLFFILFIFAYYSLQFYFKLCKKNFSVLLSSVKTLICYFNCFEFFIKFSFFNPRFLSKFFRQEIARWEKKEERCFAELFLLLKSCRKFWEKVHEEYVRTYVQSIDKITNVYEIGYFLETDSHGNKYCT